MAKTTFSDSKGVFTEKSGNGTTVDNAITFNTTPKATVQARVAASALVEPGVYTLSGNSAFLTTMPLASSVPGGLFTLRAASAHGHILSGSAETPGTRVFTLSGSGQPYQGSQLDLTAGVGNSVTLFSDGKNFCVLAASGTIIISGT